MSEINAESTTMPPVELRMPRASEREEMLAGKLYNSVDPELNALREKAGDLCARFNAASRTDHAARAAILDELLPGHGAGLDVMGPIFFDYGCNITIGERVFANFNFTVLDCCPVTIGDDVLFGPNVSLLPPMHPLRWQDRNARYSAAHRGRGQSGPSDSRNHGRGRLRPAVLRAVAAAAPRLWLLLGEEIAVSAGPIFAGGGGGETCGLGIGH